MKKTLILLVASLFIIMVGAVEFSYAAKGKLTKVELAECLCKRQGIGLPSESLSKEAYYNSLANALATKGIKMFQNSKPTDSLTCAQAVDTLYTIAGGTENLDTAAKINFLVKNGYLSTAADPTKAASTCEQILCQPPAAETYIPAPEPIRTQAPEEKKDNPVDQY